MKNDTPRSFTIYLPSLGENIFTYLPNLQLWIAGFLNVYGIVRSILIEQHQCNGQCQTRRRSVYGRIRENIQGSGIQLNKGLLNFPFVFVNMPLLSRIHKQQAELLQEKPEQFSPSQPDQQSCLRPLELEEAHRLLKYCTTVYGVFKVNSVAAQAKTKSSKDYILEPVKNMEDALKRYHGLVNYRLLKQSRAMDIAVNEHLLLLDDDRREAVLAIRGTYSISDIAVDLDASQQPFCGGYAPTGMVRLAVNLWNEVANTLREEVPVGYDLKIVGHSLGAAIASLLTMKIVCEDLLPEQEIACHAFATPPTFSGSEKTLQTVRAHITNYVHKDDMVCFMHPYTVREINTALSVVDEERRHLSWSKWFFTMTGCSKVFPLFASCCTQQTKMLKAKLESARSSAVPNERYFRHLYWPSGKTIWLHQQQGSYGALRVDSDRFVKEHSWLFVPSMFDDHDLASYDGAFRAVLGGQDVCPLLPETDTIREKYN